MVAQFVPNKYSQRWLASFHVPISDARTKAEVDFICSFAPLPDFRRIADVCCGMGRHCRALAKRGYLVTGIDRDTSAVAKARELGGGARYVQADVRDYRPEPCEYDAVIIMGQSFGHFDTATNIGILGRLSTGLSDHGRMLLDLGIQGSSHHIKASEIYQQLTALCARQNTLTMIVCLCT